MLSVWRAGRFFVAFWDIKLIVVVDWVGKQALKGDGKVGVREERDR